MKPTRSAAPKALLWVLLLAMATRTEGASDAHAAQVRRFVVAVRYAAIYKGMADGFVARGGAPANAEDAKFQAFMRRVAGQPEASFVPVFAKAFGERLTTAEARQLADFFESPLGKKIAELSVARAQANESAAAAVKRAGVTQEEQAAYQRFAATDVYRKYTALASDRAFATSMMMDIARMPAFADLKLAPPPARR